MFDAKRRLAGLARMRGEEDLARRLDRGRRDAAPPVRGGVLGPRTRRSTRWRSTARSGRPTRSPRTPATACGRGSPRRTGPGDVVDRLHGARHVQRLGDPDVRLRPAGLQPDRLPHRARSGRTTCRSIAAGFKRYGFARRGEPPRRARSSRPPSTSRTSACPSCSAASTATTRRSRSRTPSPARRRPGPPARLFLFIETMLGLRPHADRRELELAPPELPGLAPAR